MAFGTYAKGARTERELISIFSDAGYSVIRAAGSGVNSLSPDLLAFKRTKQYAFECKAWESGSLSIEKSRFERLRTWEDNTGITTFIAWRVNRVGWRFVYLREFEEKEKNFTVTWTRAMEIDRKIEEII
ncbi:MAG: Holliday junction resolvase Hjc [Candidatus Micrarchaeota archaeon]|nr:Holliday junction resolvase Hjc [Candidatus Micrarchaeota archaeon]